MYILYPYKLLVLHKTINTKYYIPYCLLFLNYSFEFENLKKKIEHLNHINKNYTVIDFQHSTNIRLFINVNYKF
jgi:hypothetical protein